jgi:hypothetical protein
MPIQTEMRVFPADVQLSIVVYNDPLYRVDVDGGPAYEDAPFKYFTTIKEEALNSYRKRGNLLRTWKPVQQLALLNLFDLATRMTFYAMLPPHMQESLDIAFPVRNGIVLRYSDESTTEHDYNVIRAICDLFGGTMDGYYIPRSDRFHSEVALCNQALASLQKVGESELDLPLGEKRKLSLLEGRRSRGIEPNVRSFGMLNFNGMNNNTNLMEPPSKRRRVTQRRRRSRRSRQSRRS